jgi:hypothetical protein
VDSPVGSPSDSSGEPVGELLGAAGLEAGVLGSPLLLVEEASLQPATPRRAAVATAAVSARRPRMASPVRCWIGCQL